MPNKADSFKYNIYLYDAQFLSILSGIVVASRLMIKEVTEIANHEKKIHLYLCSEYLQDETFTEKHKLQTFEFHPEHLVLDKGKEIGRIDIIVKTSESYGKSKSYYAIECKRLDGDYHDRRVSVNPPYKTKSLAVEYIKEGIMRFVINKYPTPFGTNGMIGFVVKPTNIDEGVDDINNLISSRFPQSNTTSSLSKISVIQGFNFVYISTHTDNQNDSIDLYHLMLDFSSIVV